MGKKSALVVFGKGQTFSRSDYGIVVGPEGSQADVDISTLIGSGSVYVASKLLEELPLLLFNNGNRISKQFTYKGYEAWWIHYNSLFHNACMPFSKYEKLLEYLSSFETVTFVDEPHTILFRDYLEAHGCTVVFKNTSSFRIPFGILTQIVITLASVIVLTIFNRPLLVFIGDKFEKNKDYDFRMKFVYAELRKNNTKFVEFIRSLESWKVVVQHAIIRKRPVIYSEAVNLVSKWIETLTGGTSAMESKIQALLPNISDPKIRFKTKMATWYLSHLSADIWAIRIMDVIVRMIGIKSGLFTAALERNFHTVLGCKLNNVPTVGILHGVASRYATPYDFMNGYTGEKRMSLDKYGVWSDWWKQYYIENSDTYSESQLVVAGPMRPQEFKNTERHIDSKTRVLIIGEQTAEPKEVMPYIDHVLGMSGVEITIKFRDFRDGFERWLSLNRKDILSNPKLKIIRGSMQDAVSEADVVIGCHSTGVLEALLQLRVPIFMRTDRWGDYYNMSQTNERKQLIADNPADLEQKILHAKNISADLLTDLREQYFGDPRQNGSVWAVQTVLKNSKLL